MCANKTAVFMVLAIIVLLGGFYAPKFTIVGVSILVVLGVVYLFFLFRFRHTSQNSKLETIMLMASELGLSRLAMFLIKKGANPLAVTSDGMCAFQLALMKHDCRFVSCLLDKGFPIYSPIGFSRKLHPITWAALYNDIPMAMLLVQRGANVNVFVKEQIVMHCNYISPLSVAVENRSPIMAALLLHFGANPDAIESENTVRMIKRTIRDKVKIYTGEIPAFFENPSYIETYLSQVFANVQQ